MKIPLRIIQQKTLSSEKTFSVLEGVKILLFNISVLCTKKILAGSDGWYKTSESSVEKISDYSLLMTKEGLLKFVETPSIAESHEVALEITQEVK